MDARFRWASYIHESARPEGSEQDRLRDSTSLGGRVMSFLYREAGRVLQGVESGKASLKTLTLGRANSVGGGRGGDEDGPKRKLYAMVSETLRYKPLLDRLVLKADPKGTLFSDEHMREKAQGYVMVYDMLLGKGSIQGGGKLKRHITQYKTRLEECLEETKIAQGLPADAANESLLPKSARRHIFPRYARVNLMTCPEGAEGVAATLRKEGFTVKIDDVVPSLLVLPPGTDMHDHSMVKDGRLVLQDKSSCFSAEALLGEEAFSGARHEGLDWRGGDVIDACAAPGNKTMHAASLLSQATCFPAGKGDSRKRKAGMSDSVMKNAIDDKSKPTAKSTSKVFAFDKDLRRLTLMQRRVDEARAGGSIETRLQDFLEVKPTDKRFAKVGAILLDPSCSGSGIVSAPDRLHENPENDNEGGWTGGEKARVERLAAFQLQGLLKAMSFPQVKRICYSTCSVHVEENEDVVAKALEHQRHDQQKEQGALVPELNGNHNVTSTTSADVSKGVAQNTSATKDDDGVVPASLSSATVNGDKAKMIPGNTTGDSTSQSDLSSNGTGVMRSGGRDTFRLSRCLSRWPRRGLAVAGLDKRQAACMVRTDPAEDETNGFFVAVLERSSGDGENSGGSNDMEAGGGEGGEEMVKKKRNRHKNRKKKKKKRKVEEMPHAEETAGER